jgi:hypothetical protein
MERGEGITVSALSISYTTGLAVIALSETEWRISDPNRRSDDARSLIGFIQLIHHRYEITVIGRPGQRHYTHSFDAAIHYLASNPGPQEP